MELSRPQSNEEQIQQRLRRVRYPGFQSNIVSQGFVQGIEVEQGLVTVRFAPDTRDEKKVQVMTENIRSELAELPGVQRVVVARARPFAEEDAGGSLTPLQAELLEDGVRPQPDQLSAALPRADIALEAGYGADGPVNLPSPEEAAGEIPQDRYHGTPPVFQWEIDPAEPDAECGEVRVERGDWEYELWWQVHPAGLVYASIQALAGATETSSERPHPLGRNVVVNLVYDQRREGVVAIYGTARDFRPFVEVFREGFGQKTHGQDEEKPDE